MRQRKIKNLDEKLAALSAHVVDSPDAWKGRWRSRLGAERICLEIGCGKGKFIDSLAGRYPETGFVAVEGNLSVAYHALEKVESSGHNVLFLLQYIQILSIFLPGAPIQIASGIVFGTWIGFLTCYIAYNLANLTLFFLTRKLGDSIRQIIARDRPKDSSLIERILASPAIGVILLCLIPIVPNGLVPVFAYPALFRMRFKLPTDYDFTYFEDKENSVFKVNSTVDGSFVMPEEPFAITDKTDFITSSGFKRLLVDFSKTKVSRSQIKAITTSMVKGQPLPGVSRFNWKDGFYSPQQMEEYRLSNERAAERKAAAARGGKGARSGKPGGKRR